MQPAAQRDLARLRPASGLSATIAAFSSGTAAQGSAPGGHWANYLPHDPPASGEAGSITHRRLSTPGGAPLTRNPSIRTPPQVRTSIVIWVFGRLPLPAYCLRRSTSRAPRRVSFSASTAAVPDTPLPRAARPRRGLRPHHYKISISPGSKGISLSTSKRSQINYRCCGGSRSTIR